MKKTKGFYVIAGRKFKNKKLIVEECRRILKRHNGLVKGDDRTFLLALFQNHTRYKNKVNLIRKGAKVYSSVCHVNRNNRTFHIAVPGVHTKMDISFYKSITNPSRSSDALSGLRSETYDDTRRYKMMYFEEYADKNGHVICPVTNLKIRWDDCHLDHYPETFESIAKRFVASEGISLDDIDTDGGEMSTLRIIDRGLAERFRVFHNAEAEYRVVLNKVNMQRNRLEREGLA